MMSAHKPAAKRTIRAGTMVWGMVFLAIGVGTAMVATGQEFQPSNVLIALLAIGGLGLLLGSAITASQRSRSDRRQLGG